MLVQREDIRVLEGLRVVAARVRWEGASVGDAMSCPDLGMQVAVD